MFFLNKNYKNINIRIISIDWVNKDLSYEELLEYDNYDDEKIIELHISCSNESLYKDSLEIFFWEDIKWFWMFESYINKYTINSTEWKKFDEINKKISSIIINEFKTWYSIFNNSIIYTILNFILIFFILIWLVYIFNLKNKIILSYIMPISLIIPVFSSQYKRIYRLVFPKIIFGIWKQEEKIEFHKKIRKCLFFKRTFGRLIIWIYRLFSWCWFIYVC